MVWDFALLTMFTPDTLLYDHYVQPEYGQVCVFFSSLLLIPWLLVCHLYSDRHATVSD